MSGPWGEQLEALLWAGRPVSPARVRVLLCLPCCGSAWLLSGTVVLTRELGSRPGSRATARQGLPSAAAGRAPSRAGRRPPQLEESGRGIRGEHRAPSLFPEEAREPHQGESRRPSMEGTVHATFASMLSTP